MGGGVKLWGEGSSCGGRGQVVSVKYMYSTCATVCLHYSTVHSIVLHTCSYSNLVLLFPSAYNVHTVLVKKKVAKHMRTLREDSRGVCARKAFAPFAY